MGSKEELVQRLQRLGAGSLAPAELLALLIGAVDEDSARQLIKTVGGIRRLADVSPADLAAVGIKGQAAARVIAALELSRRVMEAGPGERTTIEGPEDVAREFEYLRDEKREHLCAIFLDTKGNILRRLTISIGALDVTVVHPREVFREAIREGACSVIVAHNHPSGDPAPSAEDVEVTRRLADAGKLLGVELLDHVILGDKSYVSLHERGAV